MSSPIFARCAEDLAALSKKPGNSGIRSTPRHAGRIREAVESALDELDAGRLRVAEKIGGEWHVHQWLKKAVLLSFRLKGMKLIEGAPGSAVWWDKVDSKFAGWDEATVPRGRFPRRARLRRSPLGVHRQRRRADAELRECRGLCRREHHGGHLGHCRQLRADRRQLSHLRRRGYWRRARAVAGRAHHHRGQLLHRCPI